ncbi:MAG: DUF6731 family protein [Sulfurospirillum sp.]
MKEIKFCYFSLEYKISPALINFSMSDYFKGSLNLKDHLIAIDDNKAFLEKKTENIFSFQKFRKDSNPVIRDEKTGETRVVDLKETESFIEESFFYWDFKNNVIIYQRNHHGFTTRAFEKYILSLLNKKLENDFFSLKPIFSKDGIEKLLKHNVVKSIDISVKEPGIGALKELGFDEKQIRDIDQNSIERVEIKITAKRKTGLLSMDKFREIFKFSDNKKQYNRLKLSASSSYTTTGELVDLLDDLYVTTEKIQENEKAKVVGISDIINSLNRIYEENIEEVLKLI